DEDDDQRAENRHDLQQDVHRDDPQEDERRLHRMKTHEAILFLDQEEDDARDEPDEVAERRRDVGVKAGRRFLCVQRRHDAAVSGSPGVVRTMAPAPPASSSSDAPSSSPIPPHVSWRMPSRLTCDFILGARCLMLSAVRAQHPAPDYFMTMRAAISV